jgi:predicted TIM-barrel fold metal-dependent hydrolase
MNSLHGYGASRRKFLKGTGAFLAGAMLPDLTIGETWAGSMPVIDIHQHQHYHGWTDEEMIAHQRTMGVSKTILLPAGSVVDMPSTHNGASNGLAAKAGGNQACYEIAQRFPKQYSFGVCEVPDLPGAPAEIEKYLKLGAIVIGELKFAVECDAPEMHRIYELAQAYDVPVLMHWEYRKYNFGFERFHKILEKYPRVNFIGHAVTWWANVDLGHHDQSVMYPKGKVTPGGITDRLLRDYPNMYGDLSAGSGLNSITRDIEQARAFLIRHQDKLLYGSDCADRHGLAEQGCTGGQTLQKIRELSESRRMMRKILYRNAEKLFRI